MSAVREGARAWLLAGLCATGCGDDAGTPTVPIGSLDASTGPDASSGRGDASAAADATLAADGQVSSDAGTVADGSAHPHGDAAQVLPGSDGGVLPVAQCSFEQNGISVVSRSAVSPDDPLSLSMHNDGASLNWVEYQSGRRRLTQLWFDVADKSHSVSPVPPPESDTSSQTAPASAATASGFLTVWSDDLVAKDVFNLRAEALDASGAAISEQPSILTSDTMSNRAPALATGKDGKAVVIWQTASGTGRSLQIGADGNALGRVLEVPDFAGSSGHPALTSLLDGYVLAWVDTSAKRVRMQRLDAAGAPVGASQPVDAEGNAHGTVDIATTTGGGALVWDVYVAGTRAEVRFRTFDKSANLTGYEHALTDAPDTGLMPSIAPLAGGYAVAYRSAVPLDYAVRLALVSPAGGLIAAKTLSPIVDTQLPLVLRITPDGQNLFLSWTDVVEGQTAYQLRRTWIHCD